MCPPATTIQTLTRWNEGTLHVQHFRVFCKLSQPGPSAHQAQNYTGRRNAPEIPTWKKRSL